MKNHRDRNDLRIQQAVETAKTPEGNAQLASLTLSVDHWSTVEAAIGLWYEQIELDPGDAAEVLALLNIVRATLLAPLEDKHFVGGAGAAGRVRYVVA